MMQKYLPSDTEIASLKDYKGDKSSLSDVEKYLLMLIDIEEYPLRIEIGIAKTTFKEKLSDYSSALKKYQKACKG